MKRVVSSILVLLCAGAARAEQYEVSGRHLTRGPFRGTVSFDEDGGQLRVTHALAFEEGTVELVGTGRRSGRAVVATVEPTVGAIDVLEDAGARRVALTLRFEADAGAARWRTELAAGGRTLARATGGALRDKNNGLPGDAEGVERFEGVPFVAAVEDGREVHESDPRQGGLGDCYLIAALIAAARSRPEVVKGMVHDKGDGTFIVTLKDVGRFWIDSRQKVDTSLPYVTRGGARVPAYAQLADTVTTEDGRALYELWPALIEKAWAQWRGGYDRIVGGNPGTVFDFVGGAGKNVAFFAKERTARALKAELDAAIAAGKPITVGIPKLGKLGKSVGLVGDHAYVLFGDRDGGYVLFNPWGGSHPSRPLSAAELIALDAHVQVAGF